MKPEARGEAGPVVCQNYWDGNRLHFFYPSRNLSCADGGIGIAIILKHEFENRHGNTGQGKIMALKRI
ncbi:hypothetical protein EDS67_17725 [candidate division KSB1 bacterium]|nr:MAG: hypothetical protein EDS67_17725 [candidate division KSB1 bacterium]MBC6951023.1 hypothetical protein [candidate division KSB1 bacterium]MCE7942334.1 hypothetical protein [Chlorobi bacterium CHB1]